MGVQQLEMILGTTVLVELITILPLPGILDARSLTTAFGRGTEMATCSINAHENQIDEGQYFKVLGWEPGSCQCLGQANQPI